jgi:hypothetical protein
MTPQQQGRHAASLRQGPKNGVYPLGVSQSEEVEEGALRPANKV